MTTATVRRPSLTAEFAEQEVARLLRRIKNPTTKIAGFETPAGRHLALDRTVQGVQVWTEDLPGRPALGRVVRYPAKKSRNSNLQSQANRLATGRDAIMWKLEPAELMPLLAWYQRA